MAKTCRQEGVRDKARWIGSSQIIMCLVQQGCTYIILKCAKKWNLFSTMVLIFQLAPLTLGIWRTKC